MSRLKSIIIAFFSLLVLTQPHLYAIEQHNSNADPCVIVIFGASGDQTARKLLPAIYNLAHEDQISKNTVVIGFARADYSNDSFRKHLKEAVSQFSRTKPIDNAFWELFEKRLFYNQASFEQEQGYEELQKLLQKLDQEFGTNGNRIFYLATQPSAFPLIVEKLSKHHLIYEANNSSASWSRVIIEKPFGLDLDSAIDLKQHISKYLNESQIYLMDHFLGKEGVQDLFTLRFENSLFEPLWNNHHIDNIQITLSEDLGIGSRGKLWEETGALRDLFQNHLMQLLAIVAMDKPSPLNVEGIHKEKLKTLNAIRPLTTEKIGDEVIRGQYGPGIVKEANVLGYRQEKDVPDTSTMETFVAATLFIDNDRWKGTPFYLRAGKRLPKSTTEIVITFKAIPGQVPNALFIRIQPNTGVFLKTLSKVPGLSNQVKPVIFGYIPDTYFGKKSPEAYEKLIYDCIYGDRSLFVQADEAIAAWRLLSPLLYQWKTAPKEIFPNYNAGTWGPSAADQMLRKNGHQWQLLEN